MVTGKEAAATLVKAVGGRILVGGKGGIGTLGQIISLAGVRHLYHARAHCECNESVG